MNKSLRLTCLTILATGALAGAIVACTSDNKDSGTTDGGTSNPTDSGTSNPTDGGTNTSEGGTTNPEGGSTGSGITSCTTATLFAGDPLYSGTPSDRPADGTGILADPPFQWGNLTFAASGKYLYTRDTGEVWYTDTTAAAPVEKRLFGKNPANSHVDIKFGACATALAGAINGMEELTDGSLVMVDAFANDVIHVKDPQGTGCTVESWAGTNTDVGFDDMDYPNLGDTDGAVGTSKIGYPTAITTDGADTVYFFDGQAKKLKKIAKDAVHTTSTLGKLPNNEDIVYGMTHIGSTIYFLAYDSTNTVLYKIADGATMTKVAGGGPDQWDGLGTQGPQLGGITTDGHNIIVAGKGLMWLVDVTSGTITHIAGSGSYVDIPSDAKNPTTAMNVTLKPRQGASEAAVGSPDYLGFKDGAVYYRGQGEGTAAYVEKIQCQ